MIIIFGDVVSCKNPRWSKLYFDSFSQKIFDTQQKATQARK